MSFVQNIIKTANHWPQLQHHKSLLLIVFLICIGHLIFINLILRYPDDDDIFSLPSAENIEVTENSIFYHETSKRGELTIRQACSVESCARINSDSDINVIFSSLINSSSETLKILRTYKNIRYIKVNIENYVKNTPMDKFDLNILAKSKWPMQVMSQALRYLTLYKHGGVYLDLDIIVVQPLMYLGRNWASKLTFKEISSGALSFDTDVLGKYAARLAIREFVNNFNLDNYTHNGPVVLQTLVGSLCPPNNSKTSNEKIVRTYFECQGFKIYDAKTFTSLRYDYAKAYYMSYFTDIISTMDTIDVYGYHMFNYMTEGYKIEKNSFYANLAQEYCPKIYNKFTEEFSNDPNI